MFVDFHKVGVYKCDYGLGVYAKQDLKEGEIVEEGIVYRLKNVDGNENPHLFTWSEDRSIWVGTSGCVPFYNHSENPNVKNIRDFKNDTITYIALRDIKQGEELFCSYLSKKWRTCFQSF